MRPGDPSLSPGFLKAQEHARVTKRVEGFVEDKVARLRVQNGLIDPYFSDLRAALEKGLEKAPIFGVASPVTQAISAWAPRAEHFGATGTLSGPAPRVPTADEYLQNRTQGDGSADVVRARAKATDEMRNIADGAGSGLLVTLELTQNSDGSLKDVKLLSTSGNKAYDQFVLGAVPPSLAKLAPPVPGARGVRAEGIRTVWAVNGEVVYFRKLKDMKGEDTWYLVTASALGVLTGRFEETTGEIDVVDFRHPRFRCRARLLSVY